MRQHEVGYGLACYGAPPPRTSSGLICPSLSTRTGLKIDRVIETTYHAPLCGPISKLNTHLGSGMIVNVNLTKASPAGLSARGFLRGKASVRPTEVDPKVVPRPWQYYRLNAGSYFRFSML